MSAVSKLVFIEGCMLKSVCSEETVVSETFNWLHLTGFNHATAPLFRTLVIALSHTKMLDIEVIMVYNE